MLDLRDTSRSRHAPQGLSPASKPCRPLNRASYQDVQTYDSLPPVLFPHHAALLALPVAVLLGGPLVVQLLARHQGQLALHPVALPGALERHADVPLVLGALVGP